MPSITVLAHGFNAAVHVYGMVTNYRLSKENDQLLAAYQAAGNQITDQGRMIGYLVNIIEQSEIPLSDYDAIALTLLANNIVESSS